MYITDSYSGNDDEGTSFEFEENLWNSDDMINNTFM